MRNFAPVMNMKTLATTLCLLAISTLRANAQAPTDTASTAKPFRAHIYNKEYEVALHIDLYDQQLSLPGQEVLGPLAGYLQRDGNSFAWIIVDASIASHSEARLTMVNDYGSDDLTAQLYVLNDSTYELRQTAGAALKVPKNGKWLKLPKTFEFKRKK